MPSDERHRLVIDADVLRRAGDEDTTDVGSQRCRKVLMAVLRICHRAVQTDAIEEEWAEHASRFSRYWMQKMESHRKLVDVVPAPIPGLAAALGLDEEPDDQSKIDQDIHLLEAAVAADDRILSCDNAARNRLAGLTPQCTSLSGLLWSDPTRAHESAEEWLEAGAPAEPERTLDRRFTVLRERGTQRRSRGRRDEA